MEEQKGRPASYRVDAPLRKVQSVEVDGENRYLFRHDFTRLDSSNFQLLKQHENDTMRESVQVAKGQFRRKTRSIPADSNLYKAIIQGGGWRPAGLEPVRDKDSIPSGAISLYSLNETTSMWEPGWADLNKEQMSNFVGERQSNAIQNLFDCVGEYVSSGMGIEFMYEKSGIMKVRLSIPDTEEPAYRLLMEMRRPESKRRLRFKEDFAYNVDHQPKPGKKDDLGKTETRIDIEQGVDIFREFFSAPIDDPEHSLIVFGEELNFEKCPVRPYTEEDKELFLTTFDPNYMVEIAAAMVGSFSKTDRE